MKHAPHFVRPSVRYFIPPGHSSRPFMTKTYIRHDAHDLRDRIHLVLTREPHLLGKSIRVEVIDREVLLTGSVRTYFQKQMAQESLREIEGLGPIRNQLCVSSSAASGLSAKGIG